MVSVTSQARHYFHSFTIIESVLFTLKAQSVKVRIMRQLSDLRRENTQKKVLILGAGYVTPPVVDYLSSQGKSN